jgi:two-component system, cell cycle response regulator DivK
MMKEKLSNPQTVLLVEDIDETRYFMRLEFEERGYRVIEAEDGKKAVELAVRERPDIIRMDLSLPLMDGLAAAERIRQDSHLREVQIVAVTAHQETDYRAHAQHTGFNAYATKPVDFDWLSDLINNLLS